MTSFFTKECKWWRVMAWTLAGVVAVLFITVARMQRELTFRPSREMIATPEVFELPYEDVHVETEDGERLHGWWMPAKDAKAAVLYCHTIAGNISYELDVCRFFHENGFSVLAFDYRGFGRSEGLPSEAACFADGTLFLEVLKGRLAPEGATPVLVYGRAAGGAVAARLAARSGADGLILEGAYPSYPEVLSRHPRHPNRLARVLLWNRFATSKYIQSIGCPLLQVHSIGDQEIPLQFGKELFAKAQEPKVFLEARGVHGEAYLASSKVYADRLDALVKLVTQR